MRRREFLALVGGMSAWPLGTGAQQPSAPLIGVPWEWICASFGGCSAGFPERIKRLVMSSGSTSKSSIGGLTVNMTSFCHWRESLLLPKPLCWSQSERAWRRRQQRMQLRACPSCSSWGLIR